MAWEEYMKYNWSIAAHRGYGSMWLITTLKQTMGASNNWSTDNSTVEFVKIEFPVEKVLI